MAKLSAELKLFEQLFKERLWEVIRRIGSNPPNDFNTGILRGIEDAKRIFDSCIEDVVKD